MPPGKIRKTNGKNYLQKLNRTQLLLLKRKSICQKGKMTVDKCFLMGGNDEY